MKEIPSLSANSIKIDYFNGKRKNFTPEIGAGHGNIAEGSR
jgi:hypothetical protein